MLTLKKTCRALSILFIVATSAFPQKSSVSAGGDSIRVYWMDPIEITASLVSPSFHEPFPLKKDDLGKVLEYGGFSVIRKGTFLAQDVAADGFKKGDINIVVDGERYHSACPNRMDASLSRINPMEMVSVELIKSAAGLQSGIGGSVVFHRSKPTEDITVRSGLSVSGGASREVDAAISAEKNRHRISTRYSAGTPYKDPDGKGFTELYGYKTEKPFRLGEISFLGSSEGIGYGASFTYTENIPFAYLQMDERYNRVGSVFAAFAGVKAYVNFTSHLMNNGLRTGTSVMETDAKNFTAGITGKNFEAYYRHWTADNFILMPMGAMTTLITNTALPDISLYGGVYQHTVKILAIQLSAKLGAAAHKLGNTSVLEYYRAAHPSAERSTFFPVASLSAGYSMLLTDELAGGLLVEGAVEPPETEALFIAIRRPAGKPQWVGNPDLRGPSRVTARFALSHSYARLEAYTTYVSNYVNPAKTRVSSVNYQTFANINAHIAGMNFSLYHPYAEILASYIYGNNQSAGLPLSEILPLRVSTKIKMPEFYGVRFSLTHTYAGRQGRIDALLGEAVSQVWHRLDASVSASIAGIGISLDAENITNNRYVSHLSYLRDPYAAGVRVVEPGFTAKLNMRYEFSEVK